MANAIIRGGFMVMRGLIILNPSSGMQKVQKVAWETAHKLLSDQTASIINVFYTRGKEDAAEMARSVRPGEYDFILVVGGDGTVNEVINGLILGGSRTPVTILPAGTTNDFANALNLPRNPEDLSRIIKEYRQVSIDVGQINNHYFLNVAAGGSLPAVAHRVSTDAKTNFGRLAYILEGAKEITNLSSTVPLIFECDGEREEMDVLFFIIANSKSVGGFHSIAPMSKINDGLLDLCVVKRLDAMNVLPLFTQIQRGVHITNTKFVYYRQAKHIRIFSESPDAVFPMDFDGEQGGMLPAEVSAVPEAVQLIIPSTERTQEALA